MCKRLTLTLAVLVALPLAAQTNSNPQTTGHDRGNMEHREGTARNDSVPTSATARERAAHRNVRVWTDVTRLAALLSDVQTQATVSAAMWRTIGNEANTLASRIYGRTANSREARAAATTLRTHVRALRTAAMRGNAAEARTAASAALPAAYQLIDWSE